MSFDVKAIKLLELTLNRSIITHTHTPPDRLHLSRRVDRPSLYAHRFSVSSAMWSTSKPVGSIVQVRWLCSINRTGSCKRKLAPNTSYHIRRSVEISVLSTFCICFPPRATPGVLGDFPHSSHFLLTEGYSNAFLQELVTRGRNSQRNC